MSSFLGNVLFKYLGERQCLHLREGSWKRIQNHQNLIVLTILLTPINTSVFTEQTGWEAELWSLTESITHPQRHPEHKWAQQTQFVGTEEHVNVPSVFCMTVWSFTKATSPFSTRHLQSARQEERRELVRDTCVCHSGESACRPRANHPVSAVVTLIRSLILHITHVSNTDKKNLQFALWSCNLSSHTLNANFWHSGVTAFPYHRIEVLEGHYSIKVITYSHSTL